MSALVTGATAGIGACFARRLAEQGHDLILVARNPDRLARSRHELSTLGVRVDTVSADLATASGRDAAAARVAGADVLVNNAGFGLSRGFGTAPMADEDRLLDVNVRAVVRLCHAAVTHWRERAGGRIINVASVSGIVPRPETATYGAGKAYVVAFTQALAARLRGTGITATVVCPGFTRTEFHRRAEVDMSHVPQWLWLDADAVARAGLADAERGRVVSVPDVRYKALVAAARVAPRRVARTMGRPGRPRVRM